MATYVVFNRKTGDIVHSHTEVAMSGDPLPVSKEEVLATYPGRPGEKAAPGDLDILEVEDELPRRGAGAAESLYVDVEKRVIAVRPSRQPGKTPPS